MTKVKINNKVYYINGDKFCFIDSGNEIIIIDTSK